MAPLLTTSCWPQRYLPQEEIGRGGMGAVWRVLDTQFQRPLAVKLMLEHHAANADAVARFEREAQITGQLQHPGIPPVVDTGILENGMPFFSLKLIQGTTLEHRLEERSSTTDQLHGFMSVFLQICQAVGYAHTEGIIHRDLKPRNIMVGAFGEVQVMDWGMAKSVSPAESTVDSKVKMGNTDVNKTRAAFENIEAEEIGASTLSFQVNPSGHRAEDKCTDTDPLGESVTLTRAGQVLGTLTYMPPEQARGDQSLLDCRADVFALGGILCRILTGRPPYASADRNALIERVMTGDLEETYQALDSCGADEELIILAKHCLASTPSDRPTNGSAVATRVQEYQATVQQRLEDEKLQRATAQATALEERKRRRVTMIAAGLALGLVLLAAVGGWFYQRQQALEAERIVKEQAEREIRESQATGDIASVLRLAPELRKRYQFEAAELVLTQAESRLSELATPQSWSNQITQQQRDLQAVREFDRIRLKKSTLIGQGFDQQFANGPEGDYAVAFRTYGLDILEGEPTGLSRRIRDSNIAQTVVNALDDWSIHEQQSVANKIQTVAMAVDDNPPSNQLRGMLLSDKAPSETEDLSFSQLPPGLTLLLAARLREKGDISKASAVIDAALLSHPDDFWLHFELAILSGELGASQQAQIGHYRAALALRPNAAAVYNNLAVLQQVQHEYRKSEQLCRQGLQQVNAPGALLNTLGLALKGQARMDEAEASFRQAVELDSQLADAHCNLGNVLTELGRLSEAESAIRQAIAMRPQSPPFYVNLSVCLKQQGSFQAAVEACEQALQFQPDYGPAFRALGEILRESGNAEQAEAPLRQATTLDPNDAVAWWNLGVVLQHTGRLEQAEEAYHRAEQADPLYDETPNSLGILLTAVQRYDEAVQAFQRAIELNPNSHLPHFNLAFVYLNQQQYEQAAECCRSAIQVNPSFPPAYGVLSTMLLNQSKFEEAMEIARAGRALAAENSSDASRFDQTIETIRKAMETQ